MPISNTQSNEDYMMINAKPRNTDKNIEKMTIVMALL